MKRKRCFSCGNYRAYPEGGWKWVYKDGKRSHERCPGCWTVRTKVKSKGVEHAI